MKTNRKIPKQRSEFNLHTYNQISKSLKIPITAGKTALSVGAAFLLGAPVTEGAIIYSGIQNIALSSCTGVADDYTAINIGGTADPDMEFRINEFGGQRYFQVENNVDANNGNANIGNVISGFVGNTIFTFGNTYVYPYALTVNAVIGPTNQTYQGPGFYHTMGNDNPAYTGGHWDNLAPMEERFLGFQIDIGGTKYGWVRIRVNSICDVVLVDWAYEDSGAPITPITTLPIELDYFNAKKSGNNAVLNWKTLSEVNNAGFELEKSEDGQRFSSIAWIDGHGTSVEPREYYYEDKELKTSVNVYYRLKQIDYDGSFEYSEIEVLNFETPRDRIGNFYPVPTSNGIVNFEYESRSSKNITIGIFDVNGLQLKNMSMDIEQGKQTMALKLSELASGMYFAKFNNEDGSEYKKIVIH